MLCDQPSGVAGRAAGGSSAGEGWPHHVQCEAGSSLAGLACSGGSAPSPQGQAWLRPQPLRQQTPHSCLAGLEGETQEDM